TTAATPTRPSRTPKTTAGDTPRLTGSGGVLGAGGIPGGPSLSGGRFVPVGGGGTRAPLADTTAGIPWVVRGAGRGSPDTSGDPMAGSRARITMTVMLS